MSCVLKHHTSMGKEQRRWYIKRKVVKFEMDAMEKLRKKVNHMYI